MDNEKLKERYGQSESGNFAVVDTIGVPHPYMITSHHVVMASDRFSGMLGKEAIKAAEDAGHYCGICKGKLKFDQHETALLIACKAALKDGDTVNPELHAYLLKIKPLCEADGHAGMAFKDETTK